MSDQQVINFVLSLGLDTDEAEVKLALEYFKSGIKIEGFDPGDYTEPMPL